MSISSRFKIMNKVKEIEHLNRLFAHNNVDLNTITESNVINIINNLKSLRTDKPLTNMYKINILTKLKNIFPHITVPIKSSNWYKGHKRAKFEDVKSINIILYAFMCKTDILEDENVSVTFVDLLLCILMLFTTNINISQLFHIKYNEIYKLMTLEQNVSIQDKIVIKIKKEEKINAHLVNILIAKYNKTSAKHQRLTSNEYLHVFESIKTEVITVTKDCINKCIRVYENIFPKIFTTDYHQDRYSLGLRSINKIPRDIIYIKLKELNIY